MKQILKLGLYAAALLAAVPALADQIHFTGTTTANAVLLKDTLQTLARFGHESRQCAQFTEVESRILPSSYIPANPKYRLGTGKIIRESWTATFCGEKVAFLITFWPSPEGGAMFGIGYPYPDDVPGPS